MQWRTFLTTTTILAALAPGVSFSANFEIINGQTVTTTQTVGTGDTGLINVGGTIATTTNGQHGVASGGTSTVTNNGTMTTNGSAAYGIYNTGANSSFSNSGTIHTTGFNGDAILTNAANTKITNSGQIITDANNAEGILADTGSDGSKVINSGSVKTNGTATGILTTGANSGITNTGSVTTANGNGIVQFGTGSTFLNSGTINANNGYGIQSLGSNSTVTNNNSMSTTAAGSYAIYLTGANSTATNNGTVTTSGTDGYAMASNAIGNTLTNNGTIRTNNQNAFGMYSSATNATLTNNGTITNNGDNADAMKVNSSGNKLVNNGRITVTGPNADGMEVISNNTIVNNGSITVNGSGNALRAAGNDITVTNNGYAKSTAGNAVEMGGANNTLILKQGSTIDGNVYFGSASSNLIYDMSDVGRAGAVTQLNGTINGAAPITTVSGTNAKGAKVVKSGNTVAVVTPDSFVGSDQTVRQTLNRSNDILVQHQQAAVLGQNAGIPSGTQLAANTTSMNDADASASWGIQQQQVGWVEGFGSYQQRSQNGNADNSRANAGGFLAGIDMPRTSDGYQSGAYVGGFTGSVAIGKPSYRRLDANGVLAGGYLGKTIGHYYLGGQLAAGYANNDSDRDISGATATADYNSYFVSPSLTLMRPYHAPGVTWVPSATLRYAFQYNDSYAETGSAANQSVKGQAYHSLTSRAQIEMQLDATQLSSGKLKPSFRTGIEGSTYIGSRSIDMTVLGTSTSLDPEDGNNYVDGIIGTNIAYAINNAAELYFDGEANIGLNKGGPRDNYGGTARVGGRMKF